MIALQPVNSVPDAFWRWSDLDVIVPPPVASVQVALSEVVPWYVSAASGGTVKVADG